MSMEESHHILGLLDGNDDVRSSAVASYIQDLDLREVILEQHGTEAPSTYKRNTRNISIN